MSEEILKSKDELFREDPDRFIDSNDLIIALKRTEHGPAIFLRPLNRSEMARAIGELNIALIRECIHMDMMAQTERSKIVSAKGGIINAARNRLFKK